MMQGHRTYLDLLPYMRQHAKQHRPGHLAYAVLPTYRRRSIKEVNCEQETA